jgi:hypothetical protein
MQRQHTRKRKMTVAERSNQHPSFVFYTIEKTNAVTFFLAYTLTFFLAFYLAYDLNGHTFWHIL